ncbi:MAG: hypothetical protein EG823_03670 [Actinobacteria bacterium]|nr:hypothetical protein [Actinomycetota bacterium]
MTAYELPNILLCDDPRYRNEDLQEIGDGELFAENVRVERALADEIARPRPRIVPVLDHRSFILADEWLTARLAGVRAEIARRKKVAR